MGDDDFDDEDLDYGDEGIPFGSFSDSVSINIALVLPLIFQARTEDVEQQAQEAAAEHVETGDKPGRAHQGTQTVEQQPEKDPEPVKSDNLVFEKPPEEMTKQLKPLYITVHMDGCPVSRVFVDNGDALNVMPITMLKVLGKTEEDVMYL